MENIIENEFILKPGFRYVLRNGLVTSPLTRGSNGTNYRFEGEVQEPEYETPTKAAWLPRGRFLTNTFEHRLDIVAKHEEGGSHG
jgi:hypothetical protein